VGKRPGLQRCQEDVRRPGRRATAQPSVKCSPESFAELVEREGIVPAPYLARALWAQEQELGHSLDRRELERLLREAYDIVVAKLPASKRPGASSSKAKRIVKPRKSMRTGGQKAGRR